MNKKRMNKIIKRFFIAFMAIALVLSSRPPAMIDAAQPTPPSGVGTMKAGSEYARSYNVIGFSLMYGGYTTSVSGSDSSVKRNDDTDWGRVYTHAPKVVNDGGTLRYLRGSRYVPKYPSGWTWHNVNVVVTPSNFSRHNLSRGRSLLDNLYLESGVNRNTLDSKLVNGGTSWFNSIIGVRSNLGGIPTMYKGRLWSGGKSNFNVPRRVYTTSAGVLASAWSWSSGSQAAIKSHFDIRVSMPKIDDTPPTITIKPNSDGTWRNTTRRVTATAVDGGSGVKRMRWRIERNGSWGGWSHWQNKSSIGVNLSNSGKQRVQIQAQDNFNNTANKTSGYFHIDKAAPGGSISASPSSWTNGNVTLTFNGTDSGGSGVRRVRQSGGSWVNGSRTTRTVTSNGTYSFEVQDRAGNTKTVSRKVTNIDKTKPRANSPRILHARYTNGNDYWVRPGDNVVIRTSGFDDESRMRNSNLRLLGNGNDNRAEYQWYARPISVREYQTTGGYTSIYGGKENYWGWTAIYDFNVRANTNAGNRLFNVYSYHRDNANSNTGWVDSGLNLRTDATAPTITASPNNRGWGNGNQTVTLTHADGQSGIKTKQYKWSTSTSTPSSWTNYSSAVTQSTQGTWYLHARAVDNVDRVTTKRFGPYRIDKALPNGTISGNPTSWTNQNVTLRFNATDTGGSGVRRVRQSGGSWVNGSTTSRTVSSNGTYSFEVEDNAGNKRTVSATVNRIDKTLPNGKITQSPTGWTNGNVTLSFSATDSGGSGVKRVRRPNGTWVNGSSTSQAVTANGTYTFVVEDNAGNVRSVSRTVSNIDKSAPNATFNPNSASWQNSNRAVTVTATDAGASGFRRLRTRVQTNGTWGGWSAWQTGTTKNLTASTNGKTRFQVQVQDNAGNSRTVTSGTYHIDKVIPTANAPVIRDARYVSGNDYWYKPGDNFRVDISGTDNHAGMRYNYLRLYNGSNDNRAQYIWSNGGVNEFRTGTYSSISKGSVVQSGPTTFIYRFKAQAKSNSNNQDLQVHSYFTDNAGNIVGYNNTNRRIRVDGTAPTVSASPSSRAWGNTNANVSLTYSDSRSGVQTKQYAWSTSTATPSSWSNYTGQVSQGSNGTWYLHYRTVDRVGNVRTGRFGPYRVDKTNPNGTITGNPTSWTNGNATLTFKATDTGGSGVKRVRKPNGTWVNGSTTSQTVTANGTYTFRVEDHAGNIRDVSVTVNRIDKTVPDASSTQSPTAWTKGNVNITWNASATGSPLRRIRTHNGSAWGAWSAVSGTTSSTVQTVASNGTYHFQVQDTAGNVKQISRTVSNIDKTLPNMTVTSLNTDWTNRSIGIRTTVNDRGDTGENQHISGVQRIRMRPQGGSWGAWRKFSSTSERSSANLNETWTIDENGTYEWQLEDRAGNIRTESYTVTNIDLIPPTTSGSFTPDGWTNQTITITWKAGRTGNPGSPLDAYRYDRGNGNWTGWQNATHADAFTVTQDVTENGTYQFEIRDKAGNVSRSSVTVTKHDIVLPVGQITARFDRSERDDHVGYTSNDLVDMIDSNRVTVDVTGVEDLGISGVDFVTIEEQHRIGYGSDWMTVREIDYDWPDPYNTKSQTYDIDVSHAQDTRFILTVTDRAGNESSRVTSNVVRQSVLQFIDFRITDVVNPQLSEEELDAIRASDFDGVVELTAGTNVTFDVTYQLRHLDTVDDLSGKITIKTISDNRTDTETIQVEEDETGHNQHVTFTKTFTVPQGTPKGSEITIGGDLEAKLANGTTHKITYPSENDQGTTQLGEVGSHIEEFFRFRIVR